MKILNTNFELSQKMYPNFQKGSETDKDVIARACGFNQGMIILSYTVDFEFDKNKYELQIDFATSGEQKVHEDLDDLEEISRKINENLDDVENTLSNANKSKINDYKEVEIFSKLVNEVDNLFRENCWYEGDIVLTKTDSNGVKEKLIENYESNIGLEGVYGSIKDIEDHFNNEENLISYLEYLLDKDS
jgi:hypothetical protein